MVSVLRGPDGLVAFYDAEDGYLVPWKIYLLARGLAINTPCDRNENRFNPDLLKRIKDAASTVVRPKTAQLTLFTVSYMISLFPNDEWLQTLDTNTEKSVSASPPKKRPREDVYEAVCQALKDDYVERHKRI